MKLEDQRSIANRLANEEVRWHLPFLIPSVPSSTFIVLDLDHADPLTEQRRQ
jgi:hypothetical protein